MSTDSTQEQFEDTLKVIAEAAGQAGNAATEAASQDRLAAIEDRLASIEPLLEQAQANSLLGQKLSEYVADLRSEQVFFNRARYAVGCVSLLAVIGIVGLLCAAIFNSASPLLKAPPIAIAVFVLGMVTGATVLIGAFVKGVFRSTAERHADGFLPPALENAVGLLNKINGK